MSEKKRNRRKTLRYFSWSVKIAVLPLFIWAITYSVVVPPLPVYSLTIGGLNQQPLLTLAYSELVCILLLVFYNYVGPGAWLICLVGGLQTLLTGIVYGPLLISTSVSLFLYLIPSFFWTLGDHIRVEFN